MIYTQVMEINTKLFYFINHNMQNSFFDLLMPTITNIGNDIFLISVCILIILYSIITKNIAIRYLAITGLVAIIFADITIGILKVLINESRPFVTLDNVHLLINEDDPYSFPSGHSGNIFALATALGLNWKFKIKNKPIKLAWLLIPLALIIGFSRIYIGVHYPFDVVVGAIIGIIAGLIAIKLINSYLINSYL
jgi:undecaprenyl-diphosphatase